MQQRYGWKERLADSSWVTLCWDWFMTLVGRVVEAVLWVTMAFACYQLIPNVAQLAPAVSACAFIAQFLALDAGGLGLYKLAEQQGLERWAYARVVSGVLIGITLVTVAYAGITHAMKVDAYVTTWVEISLVIARSIVTVLYGQAMQSVKQQAVAPVHTQQELEELANRFNEQLEHLKAQLVQSDRHLQQQVTESAVGPANSLHESLQQDLHYQLAHLESTLQQRLDESRAGLATALAPLQESLQQQQEVLAAVPTLQAHLARSESYAREEIERVKAALEKQVQVVAHDKRDVRPVLHALPTRHVKQTRQAGPQGIREEKFDARAFVFA